MVLIQQILLGQVRSTIAHKTIQDAALDQLHCSFQLAMENGD